MATDAIEKFLQRYDRAVHGRSKEVRLNMSEAESLAHELAIVLGRSATLADKVIDLQEQLLNEKEKAPESRINVEMDGGNFR